MPKLTQSPRMAADIRRLARRGADLTALDAALTLLRDGDDVPSSYRDHALQGRWGGCREFHIEDDWLLIYRVATKTGDIMAIRTGTHEDLF